MTASSRATEGAKSPAAAGSAGGLSGDGITTSQYAAPAIQVQRWARNGKQASALVESLKGEAANASGMFRTKEYFRSFSYMKPQSSTGAGDTVRWRFAFHSGPYARYLKLVAMMWPPSVNTTAAAIRIDVYDPSNTIVATDTLYYGAGSTSAAMTAAYDAIHTVTTTIAIQPDTDYTARLVDVDNGIITAATVFELASMTEWFNGYLPQNFAAGGPILDVSRQNLANLTTALWRRGGSQLLNWYIQSEGSPLTVSSTTAVNMTDTTSTSPSSTTPGYWLDLTQKARLSQRASGVPVVMRAYCYSDSIPGSPAKIMLVNQAGVAQLTISTTQASAGWVTATGTLPATLDKYDLMIQAGSAISPFHAYAVSVYEYES